jgi:serine/threonine protein kinase
MNAEQFNEEAILEEALSFDSVEERRAYLEGACKGNRQLRAQVESLIEAHLVAGGFLSGKPARLGPEAQPGTVIGRYKLLEKIGEGGMGVVYMAEQQEPVRRKVALKVIKLGMDSKQVIARFEAERQALALMDHPNIAKVLDGGVIGAADSQPSTLNSQLFLGRPYFVMELVQGVPITEFCDKNHLSVAERIKLLIPVCQAIQSAHQKGIIHRDLKPTNFLVTLSAGVPHPMVIDFGVAKATNQKLTEKTVFTHFAAMIGTPAYMSPEQAEMSRLDVDTLRLPGGSGAGREEPGAGGPP